MACDNDTTRDLAYRSAGHFNHLCCSADAGRRTRTAASRRETIQMLLPVRRTERNGLLPEENVRAAEIRSAMVGHFLPQESGRAFRVKSTCSAAHRPPHSKHSECQRRAGEPDNSIAQLAEASALAEISIWM
jgi:hypothetical protein